MPFECVSGVCQCLHPRGGKCTSQLPVAIVFPSGLKGFNAVDYPRYALRICQGLRQCLQTTSARCRRNVPMAIVSSIRTESNRWYTAPYAALSTSTKSSEVASPQEHGEVVTPCCDPLSIRSEGNAVDPSRMPFKRNLYVCQCLHPTRARCRSTSPVASVSPYGLSHTLIDALSNNNECPLSA